MKLPLPVIGGAAVVLVAGGAVWLAWPSASDDRWLGYVEGEPLYIAAPIAGTLASRAVDRGTRVKAGDALFALDPVVTDAETQRLQGQLDAARAQLSDLQQARERAPEQDAARSSEAAARAQLVKASRDYERIAALAAKGFVSKAQLDAARAARDVAQANVSGTAAQVRSGALSAGRADQLRAAEAQIASAQAALRAQGKRRGEISPSSPSTGIIQQTFYNPGEWVPANMPVVAVLPDDRRKLRFFVPQDHVARLAPGTKVRFSCDGCGPERSAVIRYIAPSAEFTPPVIYSERARTKLVFMVEAALAATEKPLPLGLPVDVAPQ